jgi:hypothetical protein
MKMSILRHTTLIVVVFLTLLSCEKGRFPNSDNLIGSWTEQTDNSFKHKLVFDKETMFFFQSNAIDTLAYRLDKKSGLLFLSLKGNPSAGESNHKILLNKRRKSLTIFGLFASIPEATNETKFTKD